MNDTVFFVLQSYEEVIYLEVPKAVHREAWIYIHDHTEYAIGAVAEAFVEEPEEITPLREFLSNDLRKALSGFWHKLWIRERDLSVDEFTELVQEGNWEALSQRIWEIRKREIEASAPYRIYTVPANVPQMSGDLPPGSEIVMDRQTAASIGEEHLGREVPIEEILSGKYEPLCKLVGDIAHYYTEGQKILERLAEVEGEEER